MKFSAMGDMKKTWEDAGRAQLMEERREERKQERSHLRSHLLMVCIFLHLGPLFISVTII